MNFSDYPNAGYWIQTVAYFLSGVGGLGVLYQVHLLRGQLRSAETHRVAAERSAENQLRSSENHSRCRATLDLVLHEKTDREYLDARKKFAELKGDESKSLTTFACAKPGECVDENQAILLVLNQYEFMAIGIFAGAFDEAIYIRMKRSLLVRDWDTLSAYVHELRRQRQHPNLFIEFERLAQDWRNRALPTADNRSKSPRSEPGRKRRRQRSR